MAPAAKSKLAQIREECKASGKLWTDPEFPAVENSLFFSQQPPRNYTWHRPSDISSSPKLFDDGADRGDIEQGELGDCWLLASLSCLSMRPALLAKVVPSDQSFKEEDYCGAFHFYFWRAGEWKEVVVDDQMPTYLYNPNEPKEYRLAFTHSKSLDEFWTALLEKAYAKLFGSYEALTGGNMAEALEDFTGGLTEPYELNKAPDDLFRLMEKAFERDCMIGCSIAPVEGKVEAKLDHGLIAGHAYSVTNVKKAKVLGEQIEMVRIRNPWGSGEWTGAWSDDSDEIKALSAADRKELDLKKEDDGEFWMSFQDFKTHYTSVEICNLSPDALVNDESEAQKAKKKWVTTMEHGAWRGGSTAGGCRNEKETFHKNPQYFLTLVDADEEDDVDDCSVIIALYQKDTRVGRSLGKKPLTIGFSIYVVAEEYVQKNNYKMGTPLEKKFFLTRKMTAKSPSFINSREIVGRFKLKPGNYVIVPSTFKSGEQGNYMIRIYTESAADSMSLDEDTSYTPNIKAGPLTQEEKGHYDNVKLKFAEIAGEDLEVDAFELQQMLNESDLLATVKSSNFSIDACRTMVAIYDDDMSGKLGFGEFTELWVYICTCKKVFVKFDEDKSGSFSSFEMQDALKFLGFTLDLVSFSSIVTRYANRQHAIDFNDFLMIACKLRSTFEKFDAHKDDNGHVKHDIKKWLQLNIYS